MDISIIASGSSGNCYRISDETTTIMLECGRSFNKIRKAFNFNLSSVSACLITHEHQDHCKAISDIISAGIECYISKGTAEALGIESHRLKTISDRDIFSIGTFKILAFKTQHDCSEPLGFLIQSGNEKLVFITDSYFVEYKFKGLTHIMIECNYSTEILNENIRSGLVPSSMRRRLSQSHFELEDVKEFMRAQDLTTVMEIYLIHISSNNGDPEQFKKEIQELTGKPVYIREAK